MLSTQGSSMPLGSKESKHVRVVVDKDDFQPRNVSEPVENNNNKSPIRRIKSDGSRLSHTRRKSTMSLLNPRLGLTRTDTRDYVMQVVSTTQLHGIREIVTAKTLRARAFWILVCTLCFCAATYEICNIIITYRNDRIATKISMESQAEMQYPTVLYCPIRWIHKKKAEDYGLNQSHFQYIRSVMGDPHDVTDIEFLNDNLEADIKRIAARNNFPTVGDLMLAISLDNKGFHCANCRRNAVRKVATLNGVCFITPLNSTLYQTENLPTIAHTPFDVKDFMVTERNLVSVENEIDEDNVERKEAKNGAFVSIYDNETTIGIEIHDSIYVKNHMTTLIKLEYTEIFRFNTTNRHCRGIEGTQTRPSAAYCELLCIDSIKNKRCRKCSKFSLFERNLSYPQCPKSISPWAHYDNFQEQFVGKCNKTEMETDLLRCKTGCLPPCHENIYRISSVMQLGYGDYLTIRFIFPSFTATVYRDVETITIDTLISSIGGQTGLWLGASIVSLCQLLSYCCCPCLHWENLQSRYHSFRRSLSRRTTRKPRRKPPQEV